MTSTSDSGMFFIPVTMTRPEWRVTVGASNTDITAYISGDSVVKLGAVTTIGNFNINISNKDGIWTAMFNKGDVVKIYADYASATTQIFEGIVETIRYKVSINGIYVVLEGRDYGKDAVNIMVTKRWDTPDTIYNVFTWLITNKLTTHSTDFTDIKNVTTLVQPNWNGKSVLNCFQDLALWSGVSLKFYCDISKKWHLFIEGEKVHSNFSIVYGTNIIDMEVIDSLTEGYSNKVTIYGRNMETIPILKKVEDTTQQTLYGVYEQIITNSNLINTTQVNTEAINQLSVLSTIENLGNCTIVGAQQAIPGYQVWIINPFCNIQSLQTIADITHHMGNNGFITNISFNQQENGVVSTIQDRYLIEQQNSTIDNPFNMTSAYVGTFLDENYGVNGTDPDTDAFLYTMSQTVVWDNALMLNLLQTTGYAITKNHTTDSDITQCVVKVAGSNLESDVGANWVTTQISVDNGITWEDAPRDTLHTVIGTGSQIMIKIILISLTTKIKALGVLYI